MNEKRKAFEAKFEAQIEEWNAKIVLLKDRAKKAKAEAKSEFYKTIDSLQRKQKEAMEKLHELKAAGDDVWEGLKTGAEKAWADVRAAFHDAISKFK